MSINILETKARFSITPEGKREIKITNLSGNTTATDIRFVCVPPQDNFLDINIFHQNGTWFAYFFTKKRTIYKGSRIEIHFANRQMVKVHIHTGGMKYAQKWLSVGILSNDNLIDLSQTQVDSIKIAHDTRGTSFDFEFGNEVEEQYGTKKEGAELFQLICNRLIEAGRQNGVSVDKIKPPPVPPTLPLQTPIIPTTNSSATNTSYPRTISNDGPILDRQYNYNTAYGRKMARKQAAYNYEHGSQDYRNSIDNVGCVVWSVIIVICIIVFIIIWNVSGPEAAIKWLR